jgi:hypothetical protein
LTFPGCLGCGPGARGWGSKSIGRVIPVPRCWDRLPVQEAARSGDRPVAPTSTRPSAVRGEPLADPSHGKEDASWFLKPRPLPPGLAPNRRPPLERRSIQAALSGSRVFQASTSGGGLTFNPTSDRDKTRRGGDAGPGRRKDAGKAATRLREDGETQIFAG